MLPCVLVTVELPASQVQAAYGMLVLFSWPPAVGAKVPTLTVNPSEVNATFRIEDQRQSYFQRQFCR
jgi:hypothetical protein